VQWESSRENSLFFRQSMVLRTQYHHLQIMIHRPYISQNISPLPISSLDICVAAARENSYVLESLCKTSGGPFFWTSVSWQRPADLSTNLVQVAAFSSAVVLALNLWTKRATQAPESLITEHEDVGRCLRYFKILESR
jgi:hypothetical protein